MPTHADQRPDPDALLAHVQQQEQRAQRGRLRIFFGAAPGVGKSYAMLEAARELKNDGITQKEPFAWRLARAAMMRSFFSTYFLAINSARAFIGSPGHQLLNTSWSSHCVNTGTSA